MTTKSPLSFFSQMADHSQQQNTTSSFAWFSAPECIIWITVLGMEGTVTVTLNAITIIVYLKERSLRKRSMYLVINQAVADMFVEAGVISEFFTSGEVCGFWKIHHVSEQVNSILCFVFSPASFRNLTAISLERTHATFRLFCLLIMTVSYSSIAIKIVCGTQRHHHGITNREKKLTKTLYIVTVVSSLLALLFIIFKNCEIFALPTLLMISAATNLRFTYPFVILFYANSLVNPIFYVFKMPEFRRALFFFFPCRSQPQLSAPVFRLNEMWYLLSWICPVYTKMAFTWSWAKKMVVVMV